MSIPTESTYTPPARRSRAADAAMLREIAAILLIACGLAGLITVAFMVDARLGIAAVSVAVLATGVLLGLDR